MKTLGEQAVEKIWSDGHCTQNDKTPIRHIIDTLSAQQTCGCEKLREALENMMREYESKWSDEPHALIQAREALAQPCHTVSAGSEEIVVAAVWELEKNISDEGFISLDHKGLAEVIRRALRRQSALTITLSRADDEFRMEGLKEAEKAADQRMHVCAAQHDEWLFCPFCGQKIAEQSTPKVEAWRDLGPDEEPQTGDRFINIYTPNDGWIIRDSYNPEFYNRKSSPHLIWQRRVSVSAPRGEAK